MPKNKPYDLHPEAQREIEGSYVWYSQRSLDATVGFLTSVDEGLDVVSKSPHRWPTYIYGTRRYLLKDFPFSIVYLDDPDAVKIVAVAHHKRRPGYWKSRL
jgi:toxin ParE1/3/4